MIFTFGACELDTDRRELVRDGASVHVEPQVFDLLLHFARNPDRLVTKDELLDAVWAGRIVSEATLSSRISAARRAMGDSPGDGAILRTVARRGFRFSTPVQQRTMRAAAPTVAPEGAGSICAASSTPLLGRESDLPAIAAMIRGGARLVTLTNVGGVGKTRLALEVAAQIAPAFADGSFVVALAGVTHPDAVLGAVAGALGVARQPNRTEQESLVHALRPRELLLVVDNCEHVMEAAAALIRTILAGCPRVSVLATSRELLALDGEQVWTVSPLAADGIDSPAVRLFRDRARAIAPHHLIDADNATVIEICRQLDGIPLAIELAAARVLAMSPTRINERLHERFRLLTGGSRGGDPRHRTLHRAVAWSFDLLSDTERAVLARASVFAGGFTLDAAEQICAGDDVKAADVLDILDSLLRKSLLVAVRAGADLRYGVLETIRQFGQHLLEESGLTETFRRRHAAHFADRADANFRCWLSPAQADAYVWLEAELDNLRAAFHWSREGGAVDLAARIASDIGDMARFRLRDEAANWASLIVDAARAVRHRRLPILLTWAVSTAWSLGQLEEAKRYAHEAIALLDDPGFDPMTWVYSDLAMIASFEGDRTAAVTWARAGAAHPADASDRFGLAMLPSFLALSGYEDDALAAAAVAVHHAEATGIPGMLGIALWGEGKAFAQIDPERAVQALERSVEINGVSGNLFWEIIASLELAALRAHSGDAAAALDAFRRLLERWRHSRDLMVVAHGLGALTVLLERLDFPLAAATVHGAVAGIVEVNPFVPELAGSVPRLRERLGEAAFEAAIRSGAAMPLGKANDYALSRIEEAMAAVAQRAAGGLPRPASSTSDQSALTP